MDDVRTRCLFLQSGGSWPNRVPVLICKNSLYTLTNMRLPESPGRPRGEGVSVEEFESHEAAVVYMDRVKEVLRFSENNRPIAAQCFQELVGQNLPFETKLQVFKRAYGLIDSSVRDDSSIEIVRTLIDMVRSEKDPALKIRYMAILASDLQSTEDELKIDPLLSKKRAFSFIANDQEFGRLYKSWANIILHPRGAVKLYMDLYRRDPNVEAPPEIKAQIVDQFDDDIDDSLDPDERIKFFTGQLIRLNPKRKPTPEKRREFFEKTGRRLALSITIPVGTKYHHIDMPEDIAEEAEKLEITQEAGTISRDELFTRAYEGLFLPFLIRMDPEQEEEIKRAIEEGRLDIRFCTHRSKYGEITDEAGNGEIHGGNQPALDSAV